VNLLELANPPPFSWPGAQRQTDSGASSQPDRHGAALVFENRFSCLPVL